MRRMRGVLIGWVGRSRMGWKSFRMHSVDRNNRTIKTMKCIIPFPIAKLVYLENRRDSETMPASSMAFPQTWTIEGVIGESVGLIEFGPAQKHLLFERGHCSCSYAEALVYCK
jgi:hypothetical protein